VIGTQPFTSGVHYWSIEIKTIGQSTSFMIEVGSDRKAIVNYIHYDVLKGCLFYHGMMHKTITFYKNSVRIGSVGDATVLLSCARYYPCVSLMAPGVKLMSCSPEISP
jgi:hypothetical protein